MKLTPVVIPQVGVNDDEVTVTAVECVAGQQVRAGDVLLTITTTKATFEVEAEGEGYFWPAVEEGERVVVGAPCAYLSDLPERPELPAAEPAPAAGESAAAGGARATRKARELAARLGVDLDDLDHPGIVRERDVEAFAAARGGRSGAPAAAAAAESSIAVTPVAEGRLEADFLAEIRAPESGFAELSNELKVTLYRRFGARIGDRVSFEPGAAIYAEAIDVGPGCSFGAGTVLRAETVALGTGCLFGRDNDILCRHIRIGDMLFLVNRVLIGQGGAMNDEAALTVGHSCLISSDCLINTAHRVTIGDVSCLSPRVSVYTHSHWQNVLEGYSAALAPVEIGDHVWVTGNCLITPGARLGDGSQVLANSVVVGTVAERTIVSGVPAKVLSRVRGDLSPAEKDRIVRRQIWPAIERAVRGAGLEAADVVYAAHAPQAENPAPVQLAFGPRPEGYEGTWFDLAAYHTSGPRTPLADEVRNVLRKFGVRFAPHTWRYRADVGKFNA